MLSIEMKGGLTIGTPLSSRIDSSIRFNILIIISNLVEMLDVKKKKILTGILKSFKPLPTRISRFNFYYLIFLTEEI
jgi:hypothetical protein